MGLLIQIRKQRALEEAELSEREPKQRTMTVSELADGLGLIDVSIRMLEDTDMNEERAATTGQEMMRTHVSSEELLKEKKGLCLA